MERHQTTDPMPEQTRPEVALDSFSTDDGRVLLIVNGKMLGVFTHGEFLDWEAAQDDDLGFVAGHFHPSPIAAPTLVENERDEGLDPALVRGLGINASQLQRLAENQEKLIATFSVIAMRVTDPTHLTVEEVARIENVSTKTIRNHISAGRYSLEVVPGTRRCGIPVAQVFSGWIGIATAREIVKEVVNAA